MGLDITGCRAIRKIGEYQEGVFGDFRKREIVLHPAIVEHVSKNWPGHAAGLTAGLYACEETYAFRAGSYSGYNKWRDRLAALTGWGSADACWESFAESGPFLELINFADNEGFIGASVAAKLARDFADYRAAITNQLGPDERAEFLYAYEDWAKVITLAAQGGCVLFH